MSSINTNVSALYSQNALKTNTRSMNTAMEQLSTGTRINSAKDDAAGLAITQNMTSVIRGLNMALLSVLIAPRMNRIGNWEIKPIGRVLVIWMRIKVFRKALLLNTLH